MVSGSNLWSWQTAQPAVNPSHTWPSVSVRSRAYRTMYSSSMIPPSLVVMLHRLNPVAMSWSRVGFGSRSPASCSTVNRSNGMFWLKALMTQSR